MRWILIAAMTLLCACQGTPDLLTGRPDVPNFSAASVAPLQGNVARVYFYRDYEPYESLSQPWIYLNGNRVGASIPGGIFYRDVAPGPYEITVDTTGNYNNQFKAVTLQAGETLYVKIESLRNWYDGAHFTHDTFYVALIGPRLAQVEVGQMRPVMGAP